MKKLLVIVILAALFGAGAWFFFSPKGAGQVTIIATAPVERGSVSKVLESTGIIKSQVGASVKIGAQATGVLERVLVKEGDRVSKGDLVAQIDSRELRARIAQAQAQYELAKAKLAYAAKTLPRKRNLVDQKLEAQDSLDQALQSAQVAQYEADAAQAQLRTLQIQLSYTKIVSPIDGVVSQVAAQEGETIVSGLSVSNLITVLDPGRLEMWIYVDETDVGRVVRGLPVDFSVDAYRDRVFKGTVNRVFPEPEVRDNIVYYRALVEVSAEQAESLRPEMTTQCKIIIETRENVLTLPNTALKWVGGEQVCFVQGEKGAEPRKVIPELGLQGLENSEILGGLAEGDLVATQLVLPGGSSAKKDR